MNDNLFRQESGRIAAALIRIFGVHNLDLAQDVTQDAFFRALEVWPSRGVPENPAAWLMLTAKHRALQVLRRERTARNFAPEIGRLLESEWTLAPTVDDMLDPDAIKDDELRVMFSCCDRKIRIDGQVALILNILCGFAVDEIAAAFFDSHSAVEKRLTRAKKVLAGSHRLFDVTYEDEFVQRVSAVQRALYLLFNEGYHGTSTALSVRFELCNEALRLVGILIDHPYGRTPITYALGAVICLHGARLPARLSPSGEFIQLADQDRSLWNSALITKGARWLELAASGDDLSDYHVEAMIAMMHASAARIEDTNWQAIVEHYDLLLVLRPSPVVALNRAIALAQFEGPERGLAELDAIPNKSRLLNYPFYFAALADCNAQLGRLVEATDLLVQASTVARTETERRFFGKRIADLGAPGAGGSAPQVWEAGSELPWTRGS
ncbi:MAG: RNA polymerase sigma factor [Fimbriimonadaceae bacterium]